MDSFKKKDELKSKVNNFYRSENPDITPAEVKQWIKYQLLFAKPIGFAATKAALVLLQQIVPEDAEVEMVHSERPLLYDELEKLDKRTQNNYRGIIREFIPVFDPRKKQKIPANKPEFIFSYIMSLFTGRAKYDEKKLASALSGQELNAYKNYYKECRNYLKKNKLTQEFIEFIDGPNGVMAEFASNRPLRHEIYESAIIGIEVKF